MNKKGYSLTGWKEGILLTLLFITVFAGIISSLNTDYNQNHQIGLGVQTDGTQDKFSDYQQSASDEIKGGEADFTGASGLTVSSTWDILKSFVSLLWDFITGGFIEEVVSYIGLNPAVATIFRIIFFLSIVFSIVYILMKVKP